MEQIDLNFYRDDNKWYVNIPDVSKDECEMIAGADTMLDILSDYGDAIKLRLKPNNVSGNLIRLKPVLIEGEYGCDYLFEDTVNNEYYSQNVWLCDVTKHVFGDFPEFIQIIVLSKS